MHADVTECPGGSSERRIDPPVCGVCAGQPILKVRAVEQPEPAGVTAEDTIACFANGRIEPVDEGHSRDDACPVREVGQFEGVLNTGREGLLTNHGFPGCDGLACEVGVSGVGGADVYDIHVVSCDQRLGGLCRGSGAESGCGCLSGSRTAPGDCTDFAPRCAHCVRVDGAHESCTDNSGS
ncbi:hypothetical protein D9M72_468420 [compost metagenome]